MQAAMVELSRLDVNGLSGDAIDYESYEAFLTVDETRDWIRAWTGGNELSGTDFLIIGQDGTGGLAALWRVTPDMPLRERPVVFFGSEGELGVVASNLGDFLWLFAQGVGPMGAIAERAQAARSLPALVELARRYAPNSERPASHIIKDAQTRYSDFEALVEGTIR